MEPEPSEKSEGKIIIPMESVYKHFRKLFHDGVLEEEEGATNCPPPAINPTEKMTREQLHFTKKIMKEYAMEDIVLNVIVEKPKCVSRLWVPRPDKGGSSSSTKETGKFIGMGTGETPIAATIASSEDAYSRRSIRKAKKSGN